MRRNISSSPNCHNSELPIVGDDLETLGAIFAVFKSAGSTQHGKKYEVFECDGCAC